MGPSGYDWTYLDDREEAHRKPAMGPSHRAGVEMAAKVAFTRCTGPSPPKRDAFRT